MPPRKKKEQNSIVIHSTIDECTESEDEARQKKHLEARQVAKSKELQDKKTKPVLVTTETPTEPVKKARKPRAKPVKRAKGHTDICVVCHQKLMTQKIKIGEEIDIEIKSVLLE